MRHYYYGVDTYNLDMHTKFLTIYQALKMYLVFGKIRLYILILSGMYNNYSWGGRKNRDLRMIIYVD